MALGDHPKMNARKNIRQKKPAAREAALPFAVPKIPTIDLCLSASGPEMKPPARSKGRARHPV
jgi:hypothetical protein